MKKILPMALFAITTVSQAQTPSFKEQQIDGEVGIGYGLAVADVNGDRQTDILLADSNVIVWYENPTWKKHVIAEKLTEKDHVCIAARDIDGDGKCEIAVGAEWNPGDTTGSGAVFYLIPPGGPHAEVGAGEACARADDASHEMGAQPGRALRSRRGAAAWPWQ